MDFLAPALIGLGFYFMYLAWKTPAGSSPTPVKTITTNLAGAKKSG